MCHPLVVASRTPLPIFQYTRGEADAFAGQIYVSHFEATESPDSRVIFPLRFLYAVSTGHTGDACGFSGEYSDAASARGELADFLERSLEFSSDLQMYVAPEQYGDSGVAPLKMDHVAPGDIRTWMTVFVEGDFYQIVRDD